jgi:hypothetical protein
MVRFYVGFLIIAFVLFLLHQQNNDARSKISNSSTPTNNPVMNSLVNNNLLVDPTVPVDFKKYLFTSMNDANSFNDDFEFNVCTPNIITSCEQTGETYLVSSIITSNSLSCTTFYQICPTVHCTADNNLENNNLNKIRYTNCKIKPNLNTSLNYDLINKYTIIKSISVSYKNISSELVMYSINYSLDTFQFMTCVLFVWFVVYLIGLFIIWTTYNKNYICCCDPFQIYDPEINSRSSLKKILLIVSLISLVLSYIFSFFFGWFVAYFITYDVLFIISISLVLTLIMVLIYNKYLIQTMIEKKICMLESQLLTEDREREIYTDYTAI